MLETALSATRDLASRARLNQLRQLQSDANCHSPAPPCSERFRVHGWRWHHLGIVRDLTRLHQQAANKRQCLCDPTNPGARASRKQLLNALMYIIHDNWELHNFVEASVFLPWIDGRESHASTVQSRTIIKRERERLARDSRALSRRVGSWITGQPQTCNGELNVILGQIDRLRRNATMLFETSEALLVPTVTRLFSEKEQLRFNSTVLKNITGRQARISLVIFRDAVQLSAPVVAKREDRDDFEQAVPAPIRKLALPYWRKKFVVEKIRFITDV